MFLKLTIKLAQGLLNTMPSLFIAAIDSKRILKGQGGISRIGLIKGNWLLLILPLVT